VFFQDGQSRFGEIETVQGDSNDGLGPRFNSNQCLSCHSQPNGGGSSPAQNPLISVATLDGAKDTVPWFIAPNGDRKSTRLNSSPPRRSSDLGFFQDGQSRFGEIETVQGDSNDGLGPRFNSNQCLSCHSQPNGGGSSPAQNPLISVATLDGAKDTVPWFIAPNGPVRETRFKKSNGVPDGNVHALFVITGRQDAAGCNIRQFDFLPAGNPLTGQGGNANIIFRIPTPLFGTGLIEAIPDSAILANLQANATLKASLGISGHPNAILSGNVNRSANDGTITRFGWKARNKALLPIPA